MSATSAWGSERRRHPRFVPAQDRGPALARLRPGREVLVLNLSRGGLCIEAVSPVRPGNQVDIRFALPNWEWHGEAEVLRCQVSALPRGERVRYQAGLRFASPVAADASFAAQPFQLLAPREDTTHRVVAGTN